MSWQMNLSVGCAADETDAVDLPFFGSHKFIGGPLFIRLDAITNVERAVFPACCEGTTRGGWCSGATVNGTPANQLMDLPIQRVADCPKER
jgi:hypothetical protein